MENLKQQNIELKAELDNTKTMMAETKEELKELKSKQSSLAEETNKRLNILVSTQDILNKNQVETKEELKDLKKNVDRKALDTNKKLDSTMTKQNAEMSHLNTQLNKLHEVTKLSHEKQNAWMTTTTDEKQSMAWPSMS